MIFKKAFLILFLFLLIFLGYNLFFRDKRIFSANSDYSKAITLNDNGLFFTFDSRAKNIEEALGENKIALGEHDQIIPEKNSPIVPGTKIEIKRAVKISFAVDGKTIEGYTLKKNIRDAIQENNIELGRLDKTEPGFQALPTNNLKIVITRINVEEKIIPEDIDFKIVSKDDPQLGWREKKIEQEGAKGIRKVLYKITYKNGKEISRQKLSSQITKEPISEINVQGTYMKLGKANKGQGTWYAWKGGLYAASTTVPKGSFVKVTNLANGKSVVVEINDYGPQGKGRIIDLDKVAFAKIASLGAGVIGVKVETILN